MFRVSAALPAVLVALAIPSAAAAAETLSTTDRLDERRFVTAGPRAYGVGTEAGRYPAMGFHTRGEMGGIWSPPLKLLDGIWFAVDGHWLPAATEFTSGWGHVRMAIPVPDRPGLSVERTDFVPGDARGALIGLRLRNAGAAAQELDLTMQAHSELLSAYPWGETKPFTQLEFNLPDTAAADGESVLFTETGTPPVTGAMEHRWAAIVGADAAPAAPATTGAGFRGPQEPAVICPASGPKTPEQPPRCDDTAYGKGAGGELAYHLTVPAGGERTIWFGVAGSEAGADGARAGLRALLADPAGALARKSARRSPPTRSSACPVIRAWPGASSGASRTSPTRSRRRPGSRCARRTRGRRSRRRSARSTACASSPPASPTTRGCSPPTASTPPSRRWRWASSSRSRTTCARCATLACA